MRATTVLLPPDPKSRALERAHRLGTSLGELVRRALRAELARDVGDSCAEDSFFADQAVFAGDVPDDSAGHHDACLYGDEA